MCSQDFIITYPLERWPTFLSQNTKDSVASFSKAIAMGTPMRMMEKLEAISFWQTLEMKMPMDEAETAVKLSSMLCGSTCTFSSTSCDFDYFLYETLSFSKLRKSFFKIKRSSCSITSRMARAVRHCLFFLIISISLSTCFSYFSRISSQLLILNYKLLVWLIQQILFPHAWWYSHFSNIYWNSFLVDTTSSSCASITKLSYFVKRGIRTNFFCYMLQGSCSKKPKSLFSSIVSRSVKLLTYIIACRAILFDYNFSRIFYRISARLPILSSPGISRILKRTSWPATSKAVPSQQLTSVVTSLRLLATLMAGLLVRSLVVADLPEPERPMMSRLQLWTGCILIKNYIGSVKLIQELSHHPFIYYTLYTVIISIEHTSPPPEKNNKK